VVLDCNVLVDLMLFLATFSAPCRKVYFKYINCYLLCKLYFYDIAHTFISCY
jgi:hypothetical protein